MAIAAGPLRPVPAVVSSNSSVNPHVQPLNLLVRLFRLEIDAGASSSVRMECQEDPSSLEEVCNYMHANASCEVISGVGLSTICRAVSCYEDVKKLAAA